MTPYIYKCQHCHAPAFGLVHQPADGAPVASSMARHLDGRRFDHLGHMNCDTCGMNVAAGAWPFFGGTLDAGRVVEWGV